MSIYCGLNVIAYVANRLLLIYLETVPCHLKNHSTHEVCKIPLGSDSDLFKSLVKDFFHHF